MHPQISSSILYLIFWMFLDVRTDRMSSYRWFNETNQSLLYRWVGPFQSGALSSSATNSYIPLSHTVVKRCDSNECAGFHNGKMVMYSALSRHNDLTVNYDLCTHLNRLRHKTLVLARHKMHELSNSSMTNVNSNPIALSCTIRSLEIDAGFCHSRKFLFLSPLGLHPPPLYTKPTET